MAAVNPVIIWSTFLSFFLLRLLTFSLVSSSSFFSLFLSLSLPPPFTVIVLTPNYLLVPFPFSLFPFPFSLFPFAIGGAKKNGKTEVVTLLERFKSDDAKTRSEVRKELRINGQYSYYSPPYSCSCSLPFQSQFMIFSIFYAPAIFSLSIYLQMILNFSSLLSSLSLNLRFPCVHPTQAHHGAVPRLCCWQIP